MTRSQEALEKRAVKRSIPLEEQRNNDARGSKKLKITADSTTSKDITTVDVNKIKPIVIKKDVPVTNTNDWICSKCSNSNFHHRSSCNRCQEDRVFTPQTTQNSTEIAKSSSFKESSSSSTTIKSKQNIAITTEEDKNWTCLSCSNSNFPSRTSCNRCMSEKPSDPEKEGVGIDGYVPKVYRAPLDKIQKV